MDFWLINPHPASQDPQLECSLRIMATRRESPPVVIDEDYPDPQIGKTD